MSFINTYTPPAEETNPNLFESMKEPYDINSSLPIPNLLETNRVRLVPFIPTIHAEPFYSVLQENPQIMKYIPIDWPTFESYLTFIDRFVRQDPASMLFAIIDKTKPSNNQKIPGQLAGIIGWLHGSLQTLSVEIGPVIVLPEFQRTFVSSNATGLLLQYLLNLPSEGGLGFRRVVWCASPSNASSVISAEKMGFVKEGVIRWMWILPEGKEGRPVDGKRGEGYGRDSVMLSLCWDDWENGARDLVKKRMERT